MTAKDLKKRKKQLITIIVLILGLLTFILDSLPQSILRDKDQLTIAYIDVGQGDSTLIITPDNKNLLIDAGDKSHSANVIETLDKHHIKTIDLLIATHPDSDHIGGIADVMQLYKVKAWAMPKVANDTKTYKNLLKTAKEEKIPRQYLYAGDTVKLSDKVKIQILSPYKNVQYLDTNQSSIVVRLVYGKTAYMFMGDADIENEQKIIASGQNIQSQVLKIGHHGSAHSTSEAFLKKVNPKISIISCGKNNRYNHPSKEVMTLLKKYNQKILRTDQISTITLNSDGKTISIEK